MSFYTHKATLNFFDLNKMSEKMCRFILDKYVALYYISNMIVSFYILNPY